MTFTEEDVPLMKLIFNPETHDMGMLVGGERAKEIFRYVCNEISLFKNEFQRDSQNFYMRILRNENICNFFWDNNIVNITISHPLDVEWILRHSSMMGKVWDSGKLNLSTLGGFHIYSILLYSPIAEKILDSNMLDLTKLDEYYICLILKDSPIAKKIWDSGKLNLSLFSKENLEKLKQIFGN